MSEHAAAEAPRGIGDNKDDSLPTVDQIVSQLEIDHADALARTEEILLKGQKYLVITSDEEDEAATQFMIAVRDRWKFSEADRIAKKAPFDELAGAVHAFFKKRILDPLGLAASDPTEAFDPLERDDLGTGPRINRAQTIYKRRKAEDERRRREDEARRLREAEAEAAQARAEAERLRRAEEDRVRREQQAAEDARRREEEAKRQETARLAAEERRKAEEAALAASRKRNEDTRAAADKAAQEARERARLAEEAQRVENERLARDQAERDRQRLEEEDRLARERDERDRLTREEENRLAEARAAAEAEASAPMADLSRARGEKGGISSLRTYVAVRDVDREKLDYAILGPYFKDTHIEAALKAFADSNKATIQTAIKTGRQPVRGAVFYEDYKSSGRA